MQKSVYDHLNSIYHLDLRSLALGRIFLGLLLLVDILDRWTDFDAHYSENGVLPLEMARQFLEQYNWFSLHTLSGHEIYLHALFLISTLLAIALILGFKTRYVSLLSWIMCLSLQNRFFMPAYPGDYLMRMILFWAIFLPWGEHWSLDSRKPKKDLNRYPTLLAGIALLLFMSIFMFMAGLSKTGDVWMDGSATYYMLMSKQFSSGNLAFLLEYPLLLKAITYATLITEFLAPLLILSPLFNGPLRSFAAFSFISLFMGIGIGMSTHLLPFIMIASAIMLIPKWFWEKASFFALRAKPIVPLEPKSSPTFLNFASLSVLCFGLGLVFIVETNRLFNFGYMKEPLALPAPIKTSISLMRFDNPWRMFPDPKKLQDGWDVIIGELEGGQRINLMTGEIASWEEPRFARESVGGFRWLRYYRSLNWSRPVKTKWDSDGEIFRQLNSNHFCSKGLGLETGQIVAVEYYKVLKANTYYREPASVAQPKLISSYQCQNESKFD